MNLRKPVLNSSWLLPLLFASGCKILIPDTRVCVVSGTLLNGADCAWTLSNQKESLNFDQFLDFLEASPEHTDPLDPTRTIPAKGGALCVSADDWSRQKTALEQLCRKFKGCSFEVRKALTNMTELAKRRYR